ncbi:MAG: DUF3098 domain-containing protein [Saprospiraceae bacterium]|nr:DUF3098 domain-containing protein [Saprospiraceae bacterium]
MWALAGVGLMALGFALMAGGHMPSPDVWDPDLIYSFRRTVLAPICILSGLGLQVVAIFAKNRINLYVRNPEKYCPWHSTRHYRIFARK